MSTRFKDTRTEYQRIHDRSISEDALQRSLIEVAELHGWQWHHETDSRRSKAGFPDLVCAHMSHGVCFIELKSERGYLQPAQREWRDVLVAAGARYYVFRPRDRFVADALFARGEWPDMREYQK